MQIVLARVERETVFVAEGRRDLGEASRMKEMVVGKSVLYAHRPRKGDIEKAQAFAAKEGYVVLTYEKERNATAKAREDVLALYNQGKIKVYEG